MKKIILGLSLIISGLTLSQSFTWVNGKTIETNIIENTTVQLKIEQLAIPGDSVTLGIEVVERQIPNQWDGMLCVYGLCYGSIREVGFTGEMSQIKDDTKGYARLTVNPMSTLTQGLYKVRVFDIDNPSDGDTAVWILNAVAGIEDNYLDQISIYPNPANNNISIDSDGSLKTISMLSLNGKIVESVDKVNIGLNTIDVSGLSSGLYLVRLTNENGLVSTRKITIK